MSYQTFLEKNKINSVEEVNIEEVVANWNALSLKERAQLIQEVKEENDPEQIKFLREVSEKAKTEPGTEAGGSGDVTGDDLTVKKGGKGEDVVDDPNAATSNILKVAQAAGIGAGVGAMSLAKKLRREQSSEKQ